MNNHGYIWGTIRGRLLVFLMISISAIVFSFGCGGSTGASYDQFLGLLGGQGGSGGTGGGSGGGGGNPATPAQPVGATIKITSSLAPDVVNDVNADAQFLAEFTFDVPMNTDTAGDYITVYLQNIDGSYTDVPLTAIQWQDSQNVMLKWPAAYDSIYLITMNSGIQSVDATIQLQESVSYQVMTQRNPLDIDGLAGARADMAVGLVVQGGGVGVAVGVGELNLEGDVTGAAFVFSGKDLVTDLMGEMPILCNLNAETPCITMTERELPAPWSFAQNDFGYSFIGSEAQNLGNMSGNWRSDCAFGAKHALGAPYCNPDEGECINGNCQIPEQPTGIGCGCQGTDTCMENIYLVWGLSACIPDDGLLGCATDDDCIVVQGLGAGYVCYDAGPGYPDFCASGPCAAAACGGWPNYCNTDVEPDECYVNAQDFGSCLQDQESVVLYWDDIRSTTPTASFVSDDPVALLSPQRIGDVNGDNRADMLVFEIIEDRMGTTENIYLFLGRDSFSGTIPLADADASWASPSAMPGMVQKPGAPPLISVSAAALGDVNGDGINDFAIGSLQQDALFRGPSTGIVQVYFGSADVNALAAADFTIVGETEGDLFGISVAGGDVNGDGISDIVAGAPGSSGGIPQANIALPPGLLLAQGPPQDGVASGKAYIFRGRSGLAGQISAADADVIFSAPITGLQPSEFGASVAAVDLNADGLADVAIGAPKALTSRSSGKVFFFFGRSNLNGPVAAESADFQLNNDLPILNWDGMEFTYEIGYFLMPLGDINNDGYKDLGVAGVLLTPMGRVQPTDNYICTFLGGQSLGESNIDCDNGNAMLRGVSLPQVPSMFLMGGGGVVPIGPK